MLFRSIYIRALKLLPPDIKDGFKRLDAAETNPTGKAILGTMIRNIKVAEDNTNLLCQDTGIPIYNVVIGAGVNVDGYALKQAIVKGCARATKEHPIRSSVVHPTTRKNEHTSCGRHVPVINIDFSSDKETLSMEMIPKGSGSEFNSWLKMALPADGIDVIKTFVIDCVLEAGGKTCPPTIVGVGVGGTADLCLHLSKVAATRPLGSACEDAEGATLRRGGHDIEVRALDLVVPTRPLVPECALGEALKALDGGPAVFEIGDCSAPRTAFEIGRAHV